MTSHQDSSHQASPNARRPPENSQDWQEERSGRFSLLRQNVQPPGRPEAAAKKKGFKSKGNPAAVQFGDFFRHRILIKFGEIIHDYFLAKFERQ